MHVREGGVLSPGPTAAQAACNLSPRTAGGTGGATPEHFSVKPLPKEMVLRAALAQLRDSGEAVKCRECGVEQPANISAYHVKQLKEWVKRSCAQPAPLCLHCASKTKAHELREPTGVCVSRQSGVPLLASEGGQLLTSQRYGNYQLHFPYNSGDEPSLWVTDTASLLRLVQTTWPAALSTGDPSRTQAGNDANMGSAPPLRYYPNFLSAEEQRQVLDVLDADGGSRWCKVFRRRQQYYGETYYHTTQNSAAVQPLISPLGCSTADSQASTSNPVVSSVVQPHDLSELGFVMNKFYDRFFLGNAQSNGSVAQQNEDASGNGCQPAAEPIFGRTYATFPTQILVNEYTEDFGISSHFEDEAAFGGVIATISLLEPLFMSLERPSEHSNDCDTLEACTKVLLEPRSLFVMAGAARYEWRHGITRQSLLRVPQECEGQGATFAAQTGGVGPHPGHTPMRTVRRDCTYRRISLTIRHLLPGRKQVPPSPPP